ncbi:MAG: hypothetical protein EBQ89_10910 [Alphaproteobacteria bacterium]|jgi:hypothetical protein|nr:hypothetical protein [Alphaproteobacteria bacterium]
MEKILNFFEKWGTKITTVLVVIVFFKTCNTNSKIETGNKQIILLNNKIDSLNKELSKKIQIEGLKSEKRMIQSVDRKILDVNRQNEIDKEILQLEKR